MKNIKLTKRQEKIVYSLVKPYAEGITTTTDKKGSYFIGIDKKRYYADECCEVLNLFDSLGKNVEKENILSCLHNWAICEKCNTKLNIIKLAKTINLNKKAVCCVDNCKITPMFCNKHTSEFIGNGLKKEKDKILKFIDELIIERDNLRKSNDIWRKSADELNEDFIDTLKKLKVFIQ